MPPIIPIPTDIPENVSSDTGDDHNINIMSDSDSMSDDDSGHEGYEPLSQDPDACIDNQLDFEDDNCLTENMPQELQINFSANHEQFLFPVSVADTKKSEIEMDDKHIETIKSIMKSVTLPASNMPQWAFTVPEDQWKMALNTERLMKKSDELSKGKQGCGKYCSRDSSSDNHDDVSR